jgi:hypothetical protein
MYDSDITTVESINEINLTVIYKGLFLELNELCFWTLSIVWCLKK